MLVPTIAARLLALDTLLPGQTLRCDGAPDEFRALVESSAEPLVVVGRSRLTLHSRGVEVCTQSDGDDILLRATGRLAEISDDGQDEVLWQQPHHDGLVRRVCRRLWSEQALLLIQI